jgi:transposase
MNALFYLLKTGCQWRMLPKGFPPWKTVYTHFRKWRESGRIQRLCRRLRRAVRLMAGRHPSPSAAVTRDAQSVPTARQGGPERGRDGGKNVKGRKRHVVARAMGLAGLAVVVGSANESEGQKAPHVFQKLLGKVPRLEVVFADKGYEGTPSGLARALLRMAAEHCATRRRWFLRRVRADPETMGRRAHLRLVCKLAAAGARL